MFASEYEESLEDSLQWLFMLSLFILMKYHVLMRLLNYSQRFDDRLIMIDDRWRRRDMSIKTARAKHLADI